MRKGVNVDKKDPNYDLFKLACRVSASRLYPNFMNLDAPYNKAVYVEGHPETEAATMGCVESSEIIEYMIDNKIYIETFSDAYRRLEELVCNSIEYSNNSRYIDLESINVKVKDTMSNGYVKVKKIIKNSNVNNWNRIKFTDGYSLTATGDHPLPVLGKGRTLVTDIKPGDKVKIAKQFTKREDGAIFTSKYFGTDTWVLGILLSESYYSGAIVESLGLDTYDIGENTLAREELARIFGEYKKNERRIPSEMLTMSIEQRISLLAGLIDGDGHVIVSSSKYDRTKSLARFSLGSTNKALAMTELALIRGLGYKAKLYRNKYASRHDKIKFIIDFEIHSELLDKMHSDKKIEKALTADHYIMPEVDEITVIKITRGCEEDEIAEFSYDFETESDRLDISFIQSHNCRTRVASNIYDPDKAVIPGRGNLSFTSINLPRLALLSNGNIDKFYKLLDNRLEIVHQQLLDRFEVQCMKHPINYPFLMGQGVWLGSDRLGPNDDIRAVLKHGTLGVGFIGLAETLIALIGKHHGESEEAQKLGLEIIGHMKAMVDKWSQEEKMNYSVIGTPAEGLSGRFVRIDKKRFGIIPGITDKDYYTNSSHVPVYYPISAYKKIQIEAPYHALQLGGHIGYIEMDGDPTKNLAAFEKLVLYMYENNMGYISINHPLDYDPVCEYRGVINDVCPRCGRKEFEPMTTEMWMRIKGYAGVGNSDTIGYHGDMNEEEDRIPNTF